MNFEWSEHVEVTITSKYLKICGSNWIYSKYLTEIKILPNYWNSSNCLLNSKVEKLRRSSNNG